MTTAATVRSLLFFGAAILAGCASRAAKSPQPPADSGAPAASEPASADVSVPGPDLLPKLLAEAASATAEVVPAKDLQPVPLAPTASPTAVGVRLARVAAEGELNPCRSKPSGDEPFLDATQRRLHETLCGASLWFDGLFGERRNVSAAQGANGHVELSYLDSQYEGTKVKMRGNVRVDLPNLNARVHAFLGRDDQDDFIKDRTEGLALRSQFINIETNEGWLAGLGYGLPGSYKQRSDVRVGGKLGSEPEIFVQARHRRNKILDRHNIIRFRETLFWTNRDGFGSTTSFDYDHILRRAMLFRWSNIGTVSEETKGLEYRTAFLLYHDLPGQSAIAYEIFLRGWTKAETDIREYGGRTIFRHSIFGRNWLVGELVLGYSWPREHLFENRDGSMTFGLGVEMFFGPQLFQ